MPDTNKEKPYFASVASSLQAFHLSTSIALSFPAFEDIVAGVV
jgi:hypothetical protein